MPGRRTLSRFWRSQLIPFAWRRQSIRRFTADNLSRLWSRRTKATSPISAWLPSPVLLTRTAFRLPLILRCGPLMRAEGAAPAHADQPPFDRLFELDRSQLLASGTEGRDT